jgi:hypothetical protein
VVLRLVVEFLLHVVRGVAFTQHHVAAVVPHITAGLMTATLTHHPSEGSEARRSACLALLRAMASSLASSICARTRTHISAGESERVAMRSSRAMMTSTTVR